MDDDDGTTLLTNACELTPNDSIWHDAGGHCFCRETQSVGCDIPSDCSGRCGPGCGSTGAGVYSLDCAEHDRCCRIHGGCVNPLDPECGDEFREAADDFLFGTPNCQGCFPLDVVIVIDVTGSMWDDIAAVKVGAATVAQELATRTSDLRIGLVTYKDFPVYPYGSPGDFPFRTNLGFSTDPDAVIAAIQALTVGGGADWPESVHSALMHAISFPWRDGVTKVIVGPLGDAPPHDPEPFTGFTAATVIGAAEAVDPVIIYPIVVGFDPTTRAAFSVLAEGTGGVLFEAPTASEVVDAIVEAIGVITPTNNPPDCTFAVADPSQLWPPNHTLAPISIVGVEDPDGDPVTVTVTTITQDEPVLGVSSGDTAPDGFGVGTTSAMLRAERAGGGNSRVYVISFIARDDKGGECTGAVMAAVPHDQGANTLIVDDGQIYDSTVSP